MLLSAEHLSINFGSRQLLEDVNFYLNEGDKVGVIGINGTGKSTLLKIIIGAQPQTSGTMSFHGAPYEPKTPMDANKAGVGMVFQEQSLIVTLTVAHNIFFGH